MKTKLVWQRPFSGSLDVGMAARHVLVRTNMERARHGLTPLQSMSGLDEVAMIHTRNMLTHRFFAHDDPWGRGPQDRLALVRPDLIGAAGENLARVCAERAQDVAHTLVAEWMDSPGHRRNILTPQFSHMGVAVQRDGPYAYGTQVFTALHARLLTEGSPVLVGRGRGALRFESFASPGERGTVCALLAPRTGSHSGGARVRLQPRWTGAIFTVDWPDELPPGTYNLQVAQGNPLCVAPAAVPVTRL